MMRKLLLLGLALSVFVAFAAPGIAAEKVIKIGYIGALTGDTAVWGQAGLNGMKLTAKKVNDAGGVLGSAIEVIGMDGKGKPEDSLNALSKLIDMGVIAVVGTNFSSCNIPMAPVATAKKIPLLATAASDPKVTVDETGKLLEYSFRIGFIDPFQGRVLAAFAIEKLGAKTAAILTDIGSDYSYGLSSYFEEEFRKLGGKIVASEQGRAGDNDYRAQLSKLKTVNPDVILVPWIDKDVALIAKQARELGIKAAFMGGDGWDNQDMITMAGAALEGGYYTSQPSFGREVTKPYYDEYVKTYNIKPETEALFGHDAVMWIVDALKRAGKADSVALKGALENTTGFEGLMGTMNIEKKTHNPVKPCSVMTIKGGKIVYVGDFMPKN